MANDREVLRAVWEGKIAMCFQADPDDLVGVQQPEPFYLMVPRITYLPLVTDKVRKHFIRFISNEQQDGEVWFDCDGTPLKWHYPIGILYDLSQGENATLPWNITIHFSKFPEDIIFKCSNKETVEAHFMSCLKEADMLKHRGQVMSAMQKKDHTQIWLGLVNGKFDQFWTINRRLMETPSENDCFRHIPVRCYHEDGSYYQKLISPIGPDNQKRVFQHLLDEFTTTKKAIVSANIHGIEISPETPLQWLSEHLSYPDNFLHICMRHI